MTEQEKINELNIKLAELKDKNLLLKTALRDAINFAQETAVNLSHLGENRDLQKSTNFLEDTISRGLRLNETYRSLFEE